MLTLRLGDCVEVMARISGGTIAAIVSDPPYGLEFMGKEWDNLTAVRKANRGTLTNMVTASGKPKFQTKAPAFDLSVESQHAMQEWHRDWLSEAFRVLRPGGVIKAFSGTRTFHRLAVAMTDVGFVNLSLESWNYGSGFPKSMDVGKALDKRGGQSLAWFVEYVDAECEKRGIAKKDITALFPSKNGNMTGWFWNKKSGEQDLSPEQFNRIRDFLQLPFADLVEAERAVVGSKKAGLGSGATYAFQEGNASRVCEVPITMAATEAAKVWDGWGTALKPAWEPVVVGWKP